MKHKEPPRGRPILAIFYDREKRPYRAAHYARIDTALPRLTYSTSPTPAMSWS